jgi:drug/metabolite transporter (DMT)-like permease
MTSPGSDRRRHRVAVATMVLCALLWSTAGVMTRHLEHAGGFELTFWRSLACILFVTGYLMVTKRTRWLATITASGVPGLISGLMWAVMFTCFMLALTITTVAKTLVVLAIAPLLTALLAWLILGEKIAARTWAAILVAGAGIVWMVLDGLQTGQGNSSLWGMVVAAGVPFASAINLINMKRQQARVDLVPALLIGGMISCLVMLPLIFPTQATGRDILLLSLLGVFQLGFPCILMIWAARHLSPQETALLALLEVVFGPLWAWLGAGERPATATFYGGGLILAALVANELFAPRRAASPLASAADQPPLTQAVRIAKSKLA